jgi:hypothetical protein
MLHFVLKIRFLLQVSAHKSHHQAITETTSWKTPYVLSVGGGDLLTKHMEFSSLQFLLWPDGGTCNPKLVAKNAFLKQVLHPTNVPAKLRGYAASQ